MHFHGHEPIGVEGLGGGRKSSRAIPDEIDGVPLVSRAEERTLARKAARGNFWEIFASQMAADLNLRAALLLAPAPYQATFLVGFYTARTLNIDTGICSLLAHGSFKRN